MAECELSVLARQCLDRRIPDIATLTREALAWETYRNAKQVTINWQFTTADARIKLRRLYPIFQECSGSSTPTRSSAASLSGLAVEKRGVRKPVEAPKALAEANGAQKNGRLCSETGNFNAPGGSDGIVDIIGRQSCNV